MAFTRRIARPLLASIFVAEGFEAVRRPEGRVPKAKAVAEPLSERTGMASLDTETAIRVNGIVQIIGGALLATGRFRRPACLFLMGSLITTTYTYHRFWEETDETVRFQERMSFLKNVGLLGGLIIAAVDTEGAPSLGWRTRHRVRQVEDTVTSGRARKSSSKKAKSVAAGASRLGRHAICLAHDVDIHARRQLGQVEFEPSETMTGVREGIHNVQSAVTDQLGDATGGMAHAAHKATAVVGNAARQLEPVVTSAAHAGVEVASEALSKLGERLPDD